MLLEGKLRTQFMTYISFYFYIFLVLVVILYYVMPLKIRWYILLVSSLLFYWYISSFSKRRFFLLIITAFICWGLSQYMKPENRWRKVWLIVSLLVTSIPLLIVKEYGFIISDILHKSMDLRIFAPIGIAFYSMLLMAYVIDVYKERITAESNLLKFLLFCSWFPQIIQGPIPRYEQLSRQLYEGHRFDEKQFVKGFMLILWGFFLKMCIADKAGVFVDKVFDNYPTYRGVYVLIAGILYSLQLYTDFLACTSLAQGISRLFGICLIDNFNHPYFSISVKDFWRRWHISLSSWLRDYIYIPLGGNRKGKVRKYANLLITFAVSGIWHGAGYKFVFWGLLHGLYQIIDEIITPVIALFSRRIHLDNHLTLKLCRVVITFFAVMLAWIIFRADRLITGLSMIKSIFTVYNPWILTNDALINLGLSWKEFLVLFLSIGILIVVSWKQEHGMQISEKILKFNLFTRWCIYIGVILFVLIFGTYGYGFDAKDFIYGGF